MRVAGNAAAGVPTVQSPAEHGPWPATPFFLRDSAAWWPFYLFVFLFAGRGLMSSV